jgi:osmotically-inducible protein OsmY
MRADHKLLVLGVTLAGAITGAMSVLIGEVQLSGFVNSPDQAHIAQAIDIVPKVAGVTSVGSDMSINK